MRPWKEDVEGKAARRTTAQHIPTESFQQNEVTPAHVVRWFQNTRRPGSSRFSQAILTAMSMVGPSVFEAGHLSGLTTVRVLQ